MTGAGETTGEAGGIVSGTATTTGGAGGVTAFSSVGSAAGTATTEPS